MTPERLKLMQHFPNIISIDDAGKLIDEVLRLRAGLESLKHWTSREINARIDAILEGKE